MYNLCPSFHPVVYFLALVLFVARSACFYDAGQTQIKLPDGSTIICPYKHVIDLKETDTIQVEMRHEHTIIYALAKIPSRDEFDIGTNENSNSKIKSAKFTVTPELSGIWKFKTLTDENTTERQVPIYKYIGATYNNYECNFHINVIPLNEIKKLHKRSVDKDNAPRPTVPPVSTSTLLSSSTEQPVLNTSTAAPPSSENKSIILIGGICGGVLALIIIIQTGVICYLRAKKIRRIEQMAINKDTTVDTDRYSSTPGRKASLKTSTIDDGYIYETIDMSQIAVDAPMPPPISTLPRPAKKDISPLMTGGPEQPVLPPKTPYPSKERRKVHRPPVALPTENDGDNAAQMNMNEMEPFTRTESNLRMRSNGKMKIPAFCAQSNAPVTSPVNSAKPIRKLSNVNKDGISEELNNILKKRRTDMMGCKPDNKMATPEPISEAKPKLSVPPVPPKPTSPILAPKSPTEPLTPQLPPRTPNSWGRRIPQPQAGPSQVIMPSTSRINHSQGLRTQNTGSPIAVPVLPAENTRDSEYVEYDVYDSDEEWTYEDLGPPPQDDPENDSIYWN